MHLLLLHILMFIRMSLICTRMPFVCHSYVPLCHSYITRMSSVCTRVSLVCHSIRMSPVCGFTMNLKLVQIDSSCPNHLYVHHDE